MKRANRNDIVLRVEKEFPAEQRERVMQILEPFVQENQYTIHELILDRAHGDIILVERFAEIAKAYAFDPRERWELFNEPDRVFKEGLHWVNNKPMEVEENIEQEPPSIPIEAISKTQPQKFSIRTFIGFLFILILAGYFFAKNMTSVVVECDKFSAEASKDKITCTQAYQLFGLKFDNITYTDVTGARLDSYTEHQPGQGWHTYFRVALITSQAEFFLTNGSLKRASEEKAANQLNQYIQDDDQTKLNIYFSLESDWTYFIITVCVLGYFIWDQFRKRK